MKKLDESFTTGSEGQPALAASFNHIQQSYTEIIDALMKTLKSDQTDPMLMYGCVNTGSGLNYIISAGAIYYNGEIFLVDAVTFTAPGGQVAVANLVTTFASVDPILFKSGATHSIHQIRKVVFAAGAANSGNLTTTSKSNYSILNTSGRMEFDVDSNTIVLTGSDITPLAGSYTLVGGTLSYKKIGKTFILDWAINLQGSSTANQRFTLSLGALIKSIGASSIINAAGNLGYCFGDEGVPIVANATGGNLLFLSKLGFTNFVAFTGGTELVGQLVVTIN